MCLKNVVIVTSFTDNNGCLFEYFGYSWWCMKVYFLFSREIVTKTLNTLALFILLTQFILQKKIIHVLPNVFIRCNFCKCIWILLYLSAAAHIMEPSYFFPLSLRMFLYSFVCC